MEEDLVSLTRLDSTNSIANDILRDLPADTPAWEPKVLLGSFLACRQHLPRKPRSQVRNEAGG